MTAPAVPTTARLAREFVTAALVAADHHQLVEDARVCVSDTVANVVRHARVQELTVEMVVNEERVRVAVRDADARRLPWPRQPGKEEEGGRGLTLVRRLSCDWGVAWVWDGLELVGKKVWFELSR
ncbi:ATP-binding protein [Streptomyces sp. NPDC001262]|uniref:ATP-binding protein n=1 Tax=Streptomyces TaxID=1883 RepID=UPI00368844ED